MEKKQIINLSIATILFLAVIIIITTINLAHTLGIAYFAGFLFLPLLFFVLLKLFLARKDVRASVYIKSHWGMAEIRKRNFEIIYKLHKYILAKDDKGINIDDQTWKDLNMDDVFSQIDRTQSSAGQHFLCHLLRSPITNKESFDERKDKIKRMQENPKIIEKLQLILYKMGREDSSSDIVSLLYKDEKVENRYYMIYTSLAAAVLFSMIALAFAALKIENYISLSSSLFLLIGLFFVNMYIHSKQRDEIKSQVNSIYYLGQVARTAVNLLGIKDDAVTPYTQVILASQSLLKKIAKNTPFIGRIEGIDLFSDYVNILFLNEERSFYKVINLLKQNRETLQNIYKLLGEIDAIISIVSYRYSIKDYVEPVHNNEVRKLEVVDIRHPLLKNPVASSITIEKGGILITGSNMSGKSTFLRTLGVNILFSQTICTCLAKSYEGSFFNMITSISPNDNILGGKSYYLSEAEALLRIIKGCTDEIPTFCIVDEIFRGTNPIERISAAAEILQYLIDHNSLTVVATHDLELTDMLVGQYECYYFSEDVTKEGLTFDYLIKKGISNTRNAIKLLAFLGYPEEIVNKSNERIEMITNGKI